MAWRFTNPMTSPACKTANSTGPWPKRSDKKLSANGRCLDQRFVAERTLLPQVGGERINGLLYRCGLVVLRPWDYDVQPAQQTH